MRWIEETAQAPPDEVLNAKVNNLQHAGIKLPTDIFEEVGKGVHRSGWPFAVSQIADLHSENGIRLDDFTDRTFTYPRKGEPITWKEPWIGIFHHPAFMPEWLCPNLTLSALTNSAPFIESKPYLAGIITLTEYVAVCLRTAFDVPVTAIPHPTEIPDRLWSPDAFLAGDRKLLQIGFTLRNIRAIYQATAPEGWKKYHLHPPGKYLKRRFKLADKESPFRTRPMVGKTELLKGPFSNDEYDDLLAESLVFLEYFDASASNTIIECVARNTPLVINRHPALAEYVGQDYPLFYDSIDELPNLLTEQRVLAAHQHFKAMDKRFLSGAWFRHQIANFVDQVAGNQGTKKLAA